MRTRFFAVLLTGVFLGLPASAQQRMQPSTLGPSALADHAARIEHDAVEDLKVNPARGTGFVDLDAVEPADKAEYLALGRYIILVLATFSEDKTELPLARVYSGGAQLKCLAPVWRDVAAGSATATAYGKFRSDSLCVLPANLARKGGGITVDYTKNQKRLEVTDYPFGEMDLVKADSDLRPSSAPDPAVLKKIIAREYPGFGFEVLP